MTGFMTFSQSDQDGEPTATSWYTRDINTLNYETVTTEMEAVRDAWDAVTKGFIWKEEWGNRVQNAPAGVPSNDNTAHRELKWVASYSDNVTFKKYTMEVGCADDQFLLANTKFMDKTTTEYGNIKTAMETNVVSPAGNAITLIEVYQVGRDI